MYEWEEREREKGESWEKKKRGKIDVLCYAMYVCTVLCM